MFFRQLLDLLVRFLVLATQCLVYFSKPLDFRSLLVSIGTLDDLSFIEVVREKHLFLHLLLLLVLYLLEHLLIFQLLVPFSLRLESEIIATCRSSLSASIIGVISSSIRLILFLLPVGSAAASTTDYLFLHLRDKVLNMLLSLRLVF